MLPDYPSIKLKIKEKLIERIEYGPSILNMVKRHTLFEGNKTKIIYPDGSERFTESQTVKTPMRISDLSQYENMSFEDILRIIDEAGLERAKQQNDFFFKTFEEIVKSVGNDINVGGKLTPEVYFEMLNRLQLDFNKDGTPKYPTFFANEKFEKLFLKVLNEIETTPELRKKLEDILSQKRDEWIDRESSRKLVG